MKRDCTELFLKYREVARAVWNLGFWPNTELRQWASERAYDEAVTRLFEGMVLLPLGYEERVDLTFRPGGGVPFLVSPNHAGVQLMVDQHRPSEPGRLWGNPTVVLGEQLCKLRFMAFFDWYQLGIREFALLEVLIEEFKAQPELVGRHGLIEFAACSISVEQESIHITPGYQPLSRQ